MPQSRPSIFGALLLIALGVLLLLPHPLGFWNFAAHYWPVLLIFWGAIRLIEFYLPAHAAPGRLSGGEVVLIIFLIFFGVLFSVAYHYRHSGFAHWVGFHNAWYWGNHYSYQAHVQAALPSGAQVQVIGGHASITLLAGSSSRLDLDNAVTVYSRDAAHAQARFQSHQPQIERQGNVVMVWPTGHGEANRMVSHLRLTLPPSIPVSVQVRDGGLHFQNWKARLSLETGDGNVEGGGLASDINVQHNGGDISLSQVAGAVSAQGHGGDLHLSDITGPVNISGDYTGFVELNRLAAPAVFSSQRAQIRMARLPGKMTWSIGHLSAERGVGLRITTRDQDVNLSGFQGGLRLEDRNGSLHLQAARLDGPIQASTREGDITLVLPGDASFELNADASNGAVHSDFPLLMRGGMRSGQNVSGPSVVQGRVGQGGPAITLSTTDGSIHLRKAAASH